MKRQRILIVEDDPDIREVVDYNLSREGYKVTAVADGEEALRRCRIEAPDLIILDLMLPAIDGLEVCRRLKADPVTRGVPIVMVTAKGEESDVVLGLGVGADDYVAKPFSPKELVARVEAVLRRGQLKQEGLEAERLVRGELTIDIGRHEVLVGGQPTPFTPTEMRLLHFLASHPGRVFNRSELLSRAIGENAIVFDRNIDVHIRAIRQKLADHRQMIETVRGVGYRFQDVVAAR